MKTKSRPTHRSLYPSGKKVNSRHFLILACTLVLMGGVADRLGAETEQRPLSIRKIEEYPAHQLAQDVAIAAEPYYSDERCNAVFEFKNLVSKRILPVLIIIENRSKSAVRIEGQNIYLTLAGNTRRHVAPLEFREVVGRLQQQKKRMSFPNPIPKGIGVKSGLDPKLDELRARAFEMKLIPPAQSDYGFVYFDLPTAEMLREIESAYLPEIVNVESHEKLMFFEINLRPALKNLPTKADISVRKMSYQEEFIPAETIPGFSGALPLTYSSSPSRLRNSQEAHPSAVSSAQQAEKPESQPEVVPKKSEIVMSLLSFITTRTASEGDKFYGQVTIPVVAEDRIVIPVNSYIVGSVRQAKRAGRLTGKAELALDFRSIIFPSGATRSLQARVRAADGYKSEDIRQSEGTIKSDSQKGKDLEEGARNASIGASMGSIIVGSTARNLRGVAYGGIGGAAAGLGLTLLKRGPDVDLQKGTQLTLVLDQDILLVKPQ